MAQFRATMQGQRGSASRLGSKKSGLDVNVNGWDNGIRIEASYDEKNHADKFAVYVTSGSNGGQVAKKVFTLSGGKIVSPVF